MSLDQFLRPYAAKGIITHEFDVDHLHIWITFRFPMNQNNKPANAKWIVEVDSVVKAITASAWVDEFTILLTTVAVASLPTVVTVEYEGPDPNLSTIWNKQWEPWGPILSSDSLPFPFGSFYGNEINWQQAAAINVWYTISDSDIAASDLNKFTFQNNQELKAQQAGYYLVNYYLSIECTIANKHVLSAPEINGVEQPDGQNHHEFGRANEESSLSGSAIFLLAVDDLVSVGVATGDAGNPTLTVQHVGLTIIKIGGS